MIIDFEPPQLAGLIIGLALMILMEWRIRFLKRVAPSVVEERRPVMWRAIGETCVVAILWALVYYLALYRTVGAGFFIFVAALLVLAIWYSVRFSLDFMTPVEPPTRVSRIQDTSRVRDHLKGLVFVGALVFVLVAATVWAHLLAR